MRIDHAMIKMCNTAPRLVLIQKKGILNFIVVERIPVRVMDLSE